MLAGLSKTINNPQYFVHLHAMKKTIVTLLFVLAVSPLLVQCASQDELNKIHYQLRMLNKKVNDLEAGTIDNLQKRQASTSSQMDQLYQEFLELKSGLDETGHLNRRLKEQSKELETAFKSYTKMEEEKRAAEMRRLEQVISEKDTQLDGLAQQVKTQQENLQAIQNARVADAKRKAAAAAKAAEEARAKAEAANRATKSATIARIQPDNVKKVFSPTTTASTAAPSPQPAKPATAEKTSSTPEPTAPVQAQKSVSQGSGNSLYEAGKYREAYQDFENIARSQEGGEAVVEARFMMGECLYALEEYDQAILDYQNIITNHPSSSKAPAAMLRQGMAFEKLDDNDTARILYQKLIATYKASPESEQAEQRLSQLQ